MDMRAAHPRTSAAFGYAAVLCGILLVAASLRFAQITDVGIRYDDEAAYFFDASLWHYGTRALFDGELLGAIGRGEKQAAQHRLTELGVNFGDRYVKPCQGFTLPAALLMFVTGPRPAGLLVLNALTGALTVAALAGLATTVFGRRAGLLAAALLAVAPYHLVYCRTALPYATGIFFVVLGVWGWIAARAGGMVRPRRTLLSGAALGYAVTCHYGFLVVPASLLLVEMVEALRWALPFSRHRSDFGRAAGSSPLQGGGCRSDDNSPSESIPAGEQQPPRSGPLQGGNCPRGSARAEAHGSRRPDAAGSWLEPFRNGATLLAGVILPALALEGLFQTARLVAWIADAYLPLVGFFDACAYWFRVMHRAAAATSAPGAWERVSAPAAVNYLVHWQGELATLAAGAGILLMLKRGGSAGNLAFVTLLIFVPLIVQPLSVARATAVIVPFACLFMAGAVESLVGFVRCSPSVAWVGSTVLLAGLAFSGIERLPSVLTHRSGMATACEVLVVREADNVLVPFDTVGRSKYQIHWSGGSTQILRESLHTRFTPTEALAELHRRGVRWVVTDPQHWAYHDPSSPAVDAIFRWWKTFGEVVAEESHLVAELPHVRNYEWAYLAETGRPQLTTEMQREGAGPIRIYELTTGRTEAGTTGKVDTGV